MCSLININFNYKIVEVVPDVSLTYSNSSPQEMRFFVHNLMRDSGTTNFKVFPLGIYQTATHLLKEAGKHMSLAQSGEFPLAFLFLRGRRVFPLLLIV